MGKGYGREGSVWVRVNGIDVPILEAMLYAFNIVKRSTIVDPITIFMGNRMCPRNITVYIFNTMLVKVNNSKLKWRERSG